MSITFRGATGAILASYTAPLNLAKPAGVANGDILVIAAVLRDTTNGSFYWPAGFTQVRNAEGWTTRVGVAYKFVTNAAGEPSSYDVQRSVGAYMEGCLAAYSGVSTTDTIVDHDGAANSQRYDQSAIFDDVTVVAGGCVLGFHFGGGVFWNLASGYTSKFQTFLQDRTYPNAGFTGTLPFTSRDGDAEWIHTTNVSLRPAPGSAPLAPTLSYPVGASVNRQQTQRFSWVHNDPDGDAQTAFDVQYRLVGTSTWTQTSQATVNQFVDLPAGTFSAGSWEWRCRTWGAGVAGAYSNPATFTAVDPPPPGPNPDAPVILSPVNDSTVSAAHLVQWSAPEQEAYQLRTVADSGVSTQELCLNPTAEVNANDWESNTAFGAYAAASISRSNVVAHGGTWSINADWPSNPGKKSVVNTWVATVPGANYRLSGWVYVPAGSPHVTPVVIFGASGETTSVTDQWVYTEHTFTAWGTAHAVGWETATNPATNQQVYVDDVSIRQVTPGPDTTTVYSDTGEVPSTAREATAAFPVDTRVEHVQVRVKVGSNWSDWDSVRVTVAHTPPPTPLVALVAQDPQGALDVQIINPAPGEGEPAVIHNEVWIDDGGGAVLHKSDQPPNSTFRHWTPVALRDYGPSNVQVLAHGVDGTTAWSSPFGTAYAEAVADVAGLNDGPASVFTHVLEVTENYDLRDTRTIT